jgi:hypothetical protein
MEGKRLDHVLSLCHKRRDVAQKYASTQPRRGISAMDSSADISIQLAKKKVKKAGSIICIRLTSLVGNHYLRGLVTSEYHKLDYRTIAHRPGVRSILPSCSNTFRALRIVVRLTYSSLANLLSVGSWLPGLRARSMISFSMSRLTRS